MARTLDPNSKSGFIRSQPAAMSAADVVKAAKAKGMKLDASLVYAVRGAKRKRAKAPKHADGGGGGVPVPWHAGASGLVAEIERIVEAKVNAILKSKLGALVGSR